MSTSLLNDGFLGLIARALRELYSEDEYSACVPS